MDNTKSEYDLTPDEVYALVWRNRYLAARVKYLEGHIEQSEDNYSGAMSDIDAMALSILDGNGMDHVLDNYPEKYKKHFGKES